MLVVNEVESTLTGQAGYDAAQTLPGPDALVTAAEGAGTLFPVAPTITVSGEIIASDQDYFAIALTAGQGFRLDVDGTSGGLDLSLFVYRPDGNLVSSNGDSGLADPGSAGTTDPQLDMVATVDGIWRFGLQAVSGLQTGAYLLRITIFDLDTLYRGSADGDSAKTGDGADTLTGFAAGKDTAPSGDDTLTASGGDDLVLGGDGDDDLGGGTGSDTLDGGAGNDAIGAGAEDDLLLGRAGLDSLAGSLGDDTLDGGAGADSLFGGAGADSMQGGADGDTLVGDASDVGTLADRDTLRGGDGDDVLAGGWGNDRLEGNAGADTLYAMLIDRVVPPVSGNSTLVGQAGRDLLLGNMGDDLLLGGADADTLMGGDGTNSLSGGTGADLLFAEDDFGGSGNGSALDGGDGGDTLVGGAFDRFQGGIGNDLVRVGELGTVTGPADFDADGGIGADTLVLAGPGFGSGLTLRANADGTGTVEVYALVMDGMVPADTLTGLPSTYEGFEVLVATGGALTDLLVGGAGGDLLQGAGGVRDRLLGGGGADTLVAGRLEGMFATPQDVLLRGGGGGDVLILGFGTGQAEGGAGNDLIMGDGSASRGALSGGDGADTVVLAEGNWFADGGAGGDLLVANFFDIAGTTTFLVEAGEGAGLGRRMNVDFAGFERFSLRGGFENDTLQGWTGADTLDGTDGGADSLSGGLGDDLYIVNFVTLLADAGGADTVSTGGDWTLASGFEVLLLTGNFATTGTGNSGANTLLGNVEGNTLSGAGGNDLLRGQAGEDSLAGGAAADTLDGGAGADTLSGGTEFDVFVLRRTEAAGDVITDFAGNGAAAGGDVIRFVGFEAGATVSQVAGTTWKVQWSTGSETFTIQGDFVAGDAVFV